MFFKSRSRLVGSLALLGAGIGLTGVYLSRNIIFQDDNIEFVKEIQSNSTYITLLNSYINQHYGTKLTSTIQTESVLKKLDKTDNESLKHFSFSMDVRRADDSTSGRDPDFAEVLSSCSRINDIWYIDSIDIKFKNSNSNMWLKLYEMIHFDSSKSHASTANLDKLLNSNDFVDSDEYLKSFVPNQKYVLKSIDILVDDKSKLNNLGAPLKLISHDSYESDSEINIKMKIEGKKRSADLIFDAEKTEDNKDWTISGLFLMYELNDDYILSNSDLAKKYYEQIVEQTKSLKSQIKYDQVFEQINLEKVIEDKVVKNSRIMNSIGRPIKMSLDILPDTNRKNSDNRSLQVKVKITGKLNSGELLLDLSRDNEWKLNKSDVKIIWNSS